MVPFSCFCDTFLPHVVVSDMSRGHFVSGGSTGRPDTQTPLSGEFSAVSSEFPRNRPPAGSDHFRRTSRHARTGQDCEGALSRLSSSPMAMCHAKPLAHAYTD